MSEPQIRYGGVIAGQEEIDAVTAVLRGQDWACGAKTREFEEKAAKAQGRAHALFVNSGSSALLLAMAALPEGSRVAMPALQFPTLYSAARWCGHTPVLVDIDDSLNMDPGRLHDLLNADHEIAAVAFVHMAGNPTGIAEVAKECDYRGLLLVEDICEAFGSAWDGIAAGNFGYVSAASTHGAHHISTGEGGLAFTGSLQAYERMRRVRDWGRAYGTANLSGYYPGYVFTDLGLNLHATDIQAALGIVQLGRWAGFGTRRRQNWAALKHATAHLPLETPRVDPAADPSWYTFPLLAGSEEERNGLMAHLAAAGIESRPIVAGNMARQPVCGGDPGEFPVADKWFRRGLWVSAHPRLTGDDITYMAGSIAGFYAGRAG